MNLVQLQGNFSLLGEAEEADLSCQRAKGCLRQKGQSAVQPVK